MNTVQQIEKKGLSSAFQELEQAERSTIVYTYCHRIEILFLMCTFLLSSFRYLKQQPSPRCSLYFFLETMRQTNRRITWMVVIVVHWDLQHQKNWICSALNSRLFNSLRLWLRCVSLQTGIQALCFVIKIGRGGTYTVDFPCSIVLPVNIKSFTPSIHLFSNPLLSKCVFLYVPNVSYIVSFNLQLQPTVGNYCIIVGKYLNKLQLFLVYWQLSMQSNTLSAGPGGAGSPSNINQ